MAQLISLFNSRRCLSKREKYRSVHWDDLSFGNQLPPMLDAMLCLKRREGKMEREKPPFFEELGSHGELKQVASCADAMALPWSLMMASDCQEEIWPSHALPMILSQTPEDALEQMSFINERWGVAGAHVGILAHEHFIDSEGALEAARLLLDADFMPILRAPLNWSVATRLSEIGCLAVDIQAVFDGLESTVSRPWLLERIIRDSVSPILLSGPLSIAEANRWRSVGVSAIVRGVPS